VAPRSRILAFGAAAALVLAGILCAVLVSGLTGQLLTIVLLSLGLGGAVLLVFLEIGLSEDRDLARAERDRQRRPSGQQPDRQRRRGLIRSLRRPG
jgi:threonine/homoserine/homoserine lactone efflux protein